MEDKKDVPLLRSRIDGKAFTIFDYHDAFKRDKDKVNCPLKTNNPLQPEVGELFNRERMSTLLTTDGVDSYDYVDKMVENHISYKDLASLTVEDLQLIGFKNNKQRTELLSNFKILPNQDPSYSSILARPEAKNFGQEMLSKASRHVHAMSVALSATNHKMQLKPPEDYLVGDKYYASHYVSLALDVLLNKALQVEREYASLKQTIKEQKAPEKHSKIRKKFSSLYVLLIGTALVGTISAILLPKLMKQ